MTTNECDEFMDSVEDGEIGFSTDLRSSGSKRIPKHGTPRHSLNDFLISDYQANHNVSSSTSTESRPNTQMGGEQIGVTEAGTDPRKRVNWKQNPLVSTLFWLVGNSNQIIGCPHQDSIGNRHEIFDTFQHVSDEYPQNSVLLKRKNADVMMGRQSDPDPFQGSIRTQSFANLQAANRALMHSKDSFGDEYCDGQRSRDSLTSGNQSPNYGYGFYINMTPPVESFSRGGNKKGSAH